MISLRYFLRLFFVVLSVTLSIFSLICCCCLDSRAISSFTWKRYFGFFPRTVSAVSFVAWAISFHLLSLMFGRLHNFTSSSFLYWSATPTKVERLTLSKMWTSIFLSFKMCPYDNDSWPISLGDLNITLGAWNGFSGKCRESFDRFFFLN